MRIVCAVAAFVAAMLYSPLASAQPVVTPDPGRYASELANNMAVGGMAPLRTLYTDMFSGRALPANIEAALLTYERSITSPRAMESRVLEDLTLSESYRAVFLYHYYGTNMWVFTRLDFVRIAADEWALSAATFGSEWTNVAIATTPSFRSNLGGRR